MAIKSYKDLNVWQESMSLVEDCYRLSRGFPKNEEYGLKSQMRRAAVSIPSNIAEGNSRSHRNEYLHSVSIALGSLAELETQIELSKRLGLFTSEQAQELTKSCDKVGKMLHGLKSSLSNHGSSSPKSQTPRPSP